MYGGFTDCTKHASAAASSTTDTLFAFYTNKTKAASTEINLLSLIHVLGLDET